jgi:hypothetical protein
LFQKIGLIILLGSLFIGGIFGLYKYTPEFFTIYFTSPKQCTLKDFFEGIVKEKFVELNSYFIFENMKQKEHYKERAGIKTISKIEYYYPFFDKSHSAEIYVTTKTAPEIMQGKLFI